MAVAGQEAVVAPKISTFSSMSFEETPAEVVNEPSNTTVNEEGVINMPATVETPVNENVVETPNEGATVETPATTEEANTSAFEMPSFEEPAATTTTPEATTTPAAVTDWKEVIKKVDRNELLKEAGVDPFVIELSEHLAKGGQAADYLNARARDWNGVADIDIVKDEFKAKYPNLTPEEIDRKISRKYALEDVDDDLRSDGLIDLKSDAYELRQQRIERDKKLLIPTQQSPQADVEAITNQVLASQQAQHQQNLQKTIEQFNNHEATKALMQSKRVALDLGANGKFNFAVDKPDFITRAMYDPQVWSKLINNEKGEPNVALLQEIILHAANPAKFKNDLVNYGKSSGLQSVVAEGQNAKRPTGTAPKTSDTPTYSQGTYGRMGTN